MSNEAGGSSMSYSDEYEMNKRKRGRAIIINNETFEFAAKRDGSVVDNNALQECFKNLGFDVTLRSNLKCYEMEGLMKSVAKEDHADNDCFMCVMLSHGEDGVIHGADGSIEIQKLIEPFKVDNCPTLGGKPKIFFIQACRGHSFDHGVDQVDSTPETKKDKGHPTEPDFFIGYSVVAGYFSIRNPNDGSWFIQAISREFRTHGQKLDLVTLMTRVNKLVAYDFETKHTQPQMNQKKQMPCIYTTLTKKVYFRPKN